MIPSQNRIEILVKGATSVLLDVKGLKNSDANNRVLYACFKSYIYLSFIEAKILFNQ